MCTVGPADAGVNQAPGGGAGGLLGQGTAWQEPREVE